ncbi:MAG TPA: helix-turn-helix domain-containing protein [Mycobacterium sp.]|nr:helix-turn-helix domain-containing protein [Mycobacterium sp.]
MPRPRVHDPDQVLDAVESLAARSGPAAVTIRAISAAVGVSNGAVYHTFGSRAGLVGGAWLRAGRRFLELQDELVARALSAPGRGAAPAVVAAADAPVAFAERYPDSSKLLLTIRRDELLGGDLPADIADQLRNLDAALVGLLIRLAIAMWDRKDAGAVDTITTCIVDLPTAIVLSRDRLANPAARAQLHAAVLAVLAVGPSLKGSAS